MIENATFALLIEQLPEAKASALWNLAYDAGYGAGPAVFGLICVSTGYPAAFALTGVLILATLPAALRERKAAVPALAGQLAAPPRCITDDNARCGPGTPGGRAGTVARRPDTSQDGDQAWQFATPNQVGSALADAGYLADERHRRWCTSPTGSASRCSSRARPASARPSWPRRRRDDRRAADPAAVLRGPRRVQGALRVELQEAAAAHPGRPRRHEARLGRPSQDDIFTEEFLLTRPLLEAIRADGARRAAHRRGRPASRSRPRRCCSRCSPTTRCRSPSSARSTGTQIPLVFLTSNNTRELSEALKRRCLYLHIDYPDARAREGDRAQPGARPRRRAGRPDRPGRAVAAAARAEEGAVGLGDASTGPARCSCSARRRSAPTRSSTRCTCCSSTSPTSRRPPPSSSVPAEP